MITQAETVCTALLADDAVKNTIETRIFHDMPPSEAAFPCVTYAESNSPALGADNAEVLTTVFFVMECWNKGSAWALASAVAAVMAELGYVRDYARDAGMVGAVHQVSLRFRVLKEHSCSE